jgi:hypothetical protein
MKGHKREKSKDKELAGITGNNANQNEGQSEKKRDAVAQSASSGDVRRSPEKQIRPKSTANGTEQNLDREVLLTEFRKLVEESSTNRPAPPSSPTNKPRRKLSEAEKKKKRSTLVGPLTKEDLLAPLNFQSFTGSTPSSSVGTPLGSSGEGSPRTLPSPTSADAANNKSRRSLSPMEKNSRRMTSQTDIAKSGSAVPIGDSDDKMHQRLQKQKQKQLQKQLDRQSDTLKRDASTSKLSETDTSVPRADSNNEMDREQWRQVKAIDVVNLILRIGREQNELKLPIDQLDLLTCQPTSPTPLQFV